MNILNGYCIETEERVLTDVPEEVAAFWEEIHKSNSWKRYADEFGNTSENNDAVIDVLNKLHGNNGDEFFTTGQFLDALNVAMDAGELERKPEPAPPVERPLTRSGVPMTDSQMKWSEYHQFSENNGMEAVRRRGREDAGFAAFVRTNLRREMNEQGVGDATVNLNDRPRSNDRVIPELARWVEEYRRMPVAEVRRRSRADYNPAGYEHFNKMLNLAAAGGLI